MAAAAKAGGGKCAALFNTTVKPLPDSAKETLNSIVSGSQIYQIIIGEKGQQTAAGEVAGLYRRVGRGWKLLIDGQTMTDSRDQVIATQVGLSRQDDRAYIVTVIDGGIYLFSNQSDLSKPKTFIRFGSDAQPLFEVGSKHRRLLPTLSSKTKISIAESGNYAKKNSQTILISIKFDRPEIVGEGMTFALELLPNEANGVMRLASDPVVIDYDFHTTTKLADMHYARRTDNIVYSKLLIERFAGTDLGVFGAQVAHVKKLVLEYVNKALKAVNPSSFISDDAQMIGYNLSTGSVVRDIKFEKQIFADGVFTFTQEYFSAERAVLKVEGPGDELMVNATLDILPNKSPAVWRKRGDEDQIIFMADRTLYLVFQDHNSNSKIIELGTAESLFPFARLHNDSIIDVTFASVIPEEGRPLEKLHLVMGVRTKSGSKFTAGVRVNYLLQSVFKVDQTFRLAQQMMTYEDLAARLDFENREHILFDTLTPSSKNVAAYQQAYDASKPHIDLTESTAAGVVHIFKRPSKSVEFAPGFTYAFFNPSKGIPDPTGLYVEVEATKITGNEKTRIVGDLVANPFAPKEIPDKEAHRRYILAEIEAPKVGSPGEASDALDSSSGHKVFITAIDASKSKGADGYKLVVSIPDKDGKYALETLEFPRGVTTTIDSFRGANFVRGRKEFRNLVFAVVAFKKAGTRGVDATFAIKIDFSKDAKKPEIQKVSDTPIGPTELAKFLGFANDGAPSIVMTADLAPDSHSFSVFDLAFGKIIFPNQEYGEGSGRHKGIKFGDFKGGVAAFQNYLRAEDSWLFNYKDVKEAYPRLGRSRELAQFDSFVELGNQLDEMATPKIAPSRRILVVPAALRDLVWDFILSRATSDKFGERTSDRFNFSNQAFNLQLISEHKASQTQYLANLDLWSKMSRTEPGERNVLISRLDEITNWVPEVEEGSSEAPLFRIREVGASDTVDLAPVSTTRHDRPPHPLYLLAAGRAVGLREFRKLKPPPEASMLVVATPEEMKILEEKAAVEIENGMLESFRIQEIKDPDHNSMAQSLSNIFGHPDVKSLDFKFSADLIKQGQKLSSEQSFNVIVDYAISRFAYFITEKKEPLFESFMRFRAAFANSILSDREARRTRLIDKNFVERVLTQVFDIPMNLATLTPEDPIRLLSEPRALLKWQEAGYAGPFDLKAAMRDTIISQTRADAGKPIPSSIVLFGNTGAGKTYAFKTLVKMLKLKLYDFKAKDNNEAQAIIINVGQLSEKSGGEREGAMSAEEAISHLEKFLSTPNGYRGWILIDDIHAAKDSSKAKIVAWLRSVFESQDGMYLTEQGTRRPVRNLNIFVTLNPTADQDQIAKYARVKDAPTSEEILLATLSTNEFKVEPSFLRRWGRIVNLDYMPAGAKGPELLNSLARASNSLLNTHNRIALVDPAVVNMLVAENAQVDARTFLATSTSALIEQASHSHDGVDGQARSSVIMVVPSLTQNANRSLETKEAAMERITRQVRENTRTLALDSGLDGQLTFIRMTVDAFRIPVYESFILALQEDPRFSGDRNVQKRLLAPFLTALMHHLQAHPYVSLGDLPFNPADFGLRTPAERDVFRTAITQAGKRSENPLVPRSFRVLRHGDSTWQDLLDNSAAGGTRIRTRQDVFREITTDMRSALQERLRHVLRVDNVEHLPDPNIWLNGLTPKSDFDPRLVGRVLADQFWNYLPKVFGNEVSSGGPVLTSYAATRIFLHALDQAVIDQPWVHTSRFLLKSIDIIMKDQVLSQKPGIQMFLFTDPQRLIRPTITDFALQVIASSKAFEELPADAKARYLEEYVRDQELFLSGK